MSESILLLAALAATDGLWHVAAALPPAAAAGLRLAVAAAWSGYFLFRIASALSRRPRRINP